MNDKVISAHLGLMPPQATDIEEVVLGAALFERNAQIIALEKLTPEDFYLETHALIFKAIYTLAEKGDPIDMRTVVNQLKFNGHLEAVGGTYFIAELASKVSSAANVEYHCMLLIEKRMLRDIITLTMDVSREAYAHDGDPFTIMDKISAFPSKIMDRVKSGAEKHIKEGVISLAESINKRTSDSPEITGVPSGYSRLDKITGGWQNTDLIIIAARPSMGKTTFVINTARNAAVDFKMPVAIFSMEMNFQQITNKFVSGESDIDLKKLTSQVLTPVDWDRFIHTTSKLTESPVYIDDTAAISITDLRVRCRRMVEKYGVRMIIIDYLQLMKGELHTRKNREQEISSISRGLKLIAKELKVPVIALSQLSRDVEKRPLPKLPMLADLRESGSLEQDADIVMFLWRPAYYKLTSDGNGTYVQGLTKLIFGKHRNGELGEPNLVMQGKTSRFIDVESPYMQNNAPTPAQNNSTAPPLITSDETPF